MKKLLLLFHVLYPRKENLFHWQKRLPLVKEADFAELQLSWRFYVFKRVFEALCYGCTVFIEHISALQAACSAESQVALKTMNVSSEHCNMSDWLRLEATVKASVYVVAFSFATLITVIIITIVLQNSKLRKEVRYILLCHHLLCISSYCGLGVVFQGMRAFLANSPVLVCWVVFGAQLSVGEGILFTLALMAAHTYLVICWPLTSVSFIDSIKYKILAGTWLIIILKNACLFLIEGTGPTQIALLKSEPLCPVVLNGIPARAIGMVFLFLLLSIILGDGRIYVGNLLNDVREKDLEDLFYKYGHISEIELKNRHGLVPFAFVRFEDPRDAEDAIYGRNGYDYGQCRLHVEFPRTYGGRGGWPRGGRSGPPTRRSDFRVLVSGLPPSGSWQDLKDNMREAGDVCYADVQKDGMEMVEYLRKEDMEYALRKLDETKFRSHEGETSYIRVYPERSTSYGYSRSRSGSRGRDSPYQSRGSPHDFSPFRPY
ncbi:hypothetical protein E5288_WYG000371 [Bos mutus]|uniref:Serine/arginine-rich splicing factor 9 n=1 Tax=Bos mutus TaxID=72004 RepID=A0A6B0QP23_9CETA|nr:hypothetical protein [Bos mutus]